MKGQIECRFVGGPDGTKMMTVPAIYCRDRISFVLDTWFAEAPEGGIVVMKGKRTKDVNWIMYAQHVFRKVKRKAGEPVTYQYEKTQEVNRCAKVLPEIGRRCGHAATLDSKYCPAHDPNRQRRSPRGD